MMERVELAACRKRNDSERTPRELVVAVSFVAFHKPPDAPHQKSEKVHASTKKLGSEGKRYQGPNEVIYRMVVVCSEG